MDPIYILIEEFVAAKGRKWSHLARILWRKKLNIKKHHYRILYHHKDMGSSGKFSHVEDRDSLSYVLENHPEITEEDEHNKFKVNVWTASFSGDFLFDIKSFLSFISWILSNLSPWALKLSSKLEMTLTPDSWGWFYGKLIWYIKWETNIGFNI